MTLQNNGAISFSNLQTEFGGSNPISLSEYYRGGAYVPSSSSANIPTSGLIKLSNFYGATAIDNSVNPLGNIIITGFQMNSGSPMFYVGGRSDAFTITGINTTVSLQLSLNCSFDIALKGAEEAVTVELYKNSQLVSSLSFNTAAGSTKTLNFTADNNDVFFIQATYAGGTSGLVPVDSVHAQGGGGIINLSDSNTSIANISLSLDYGAIG